MKGGCFDDIYVAEVEMPRKRLPMFMSQAEAKRIVGSLGHPSKMPGKSYGLSAWECKTGKKLMGVPGSTCSQCYATKNFYATWIPVKIAHQRRLDSLKHPRWVEAMATLMKDEQWFRWHDSGDLQGVWHLENIVAVALRTPHVRHWLPTREYEMVRKWLRAGGVVPANLCIRLSAKMIGDKPRVGPALKSLPTSTVNSVLGRPVQVSDKRSDSIECRAYTRDNTCGKCRACWMPAVKNVSYHEH